MFENISDKNSENKKPYTWWGQAKRCTTQLENLCRYFVCHWWWWSCIKTRPNYSTLCWLDPLYSLLCSILLDWNFNEKLCTRPIRSRVGRLGGQSKCEPTFQLNWYAHPSRSVHRFGCNTHVLQKDGQCYRYLAPFSVVHFCLRRRSRNNSRKAIYSVPPQNAANSLSNHHGDRGRGWVGTRNFSTRVC